MTDRVTRGARDFVVGIGEPRAGDDGVGPAVLDELERRAMLGGAEAIRARDAFDLVMLFEDARRIVIVDAVLDEVLGGAAGEVLELPVDVLSAAALGPSSHGFGVGQALRLARVMVERERWPEVRVVAVTIARPRELGSALSPPVAAAVPAAAEAVASALASPRNPAAS